jgi:chemotaxis response regulator CheB
MLRSTPLVLVIDDDSSLRAMLSMQVQHCGYKTITANHGGEGIDIAKHELPDLIISDYNMPVKNGYDVWCALREDESLRDTPFVMATSLLSTSGLMLGQMSFLPELRQDPFFRLVSKDEFNFYKTKALLKEMLALEVQA